LTASTGRRSGGKPERLSDQLAEVHGNRTHLGGYQPPTLDLKGENAVF